MCPGPYQRKGEVGAVKLVRAFQSKILLTFPRRYSFVDHFCYLCVVFVMLSRLLIAALWSPEGKGLTSWL